MSEALKPCPFCGGSEYTRFCRQDKGYCFDIDYHRSVSVDGIRQMICINCGARGPESTRDREHCREKWNTRADDNRWQSVAEQAEKRMKRFHDIMKDTPMEDLWEKEDCKALAAFDSLRKEEQDV